MLNTKTYSLRALFAAVLVLKEHPKAVECIEFVNGFINNICNDDILKGCSVSRDDTNNGYVLQWDDVLPKYLFNADILVCKDYYHYNYVVRDRDGNYIESSGEYDQLNDFDSYNWLSGKVEHYKGEPFWRGIVDHLEKVYGE